MSSPIKILIVDDNDTIRNSCENLLKESGYDVTATAQPRQGLMFAEAEPFSIIFVDYKMPEMNGIEFVKKIKEKRPNTDVVMITGYATIEMAVEAIRLGAYDYIQKPFTSEKILAVVNKIIEKKHIFEMPGAQELRMDFDGKPIQILGKSKKINELFHIIKKVAPTDSTVLVLGESGTGKELVAKAIHSNSQRREQAFYAMDCGSLVESLFESELFGHVKGSFTGASATKHGAFELANSGTFFFDEIGNISLNVQAKILRAIQEREIRRVGGTETIPVDVRVIAATNLDLRRSVENGTFREDLYYRLSVIPIHLPPLRDRKDDIPLLVDHFMQKHSTRRQKQPIQSISDAALNALKQYFWPGNIRELENVIERALIIEDSTIITLGSLPTHIRSLGSTVAQDEQQVLSLAEIEKQHIEHVLRLTKRNISKSAKLLNIDRKTLYDKIRKFNL